MLVIHKKPVFDGNFLPEPGQCQLHTGGWALRSFVRGVEEVLYSGSYYACRRIMKACAGKSVEESRQVAAEMAKTIEALNLAETAAMQPVSPDETSELDSVDTPSDYHA